MNVKDRLLHIVELHQRDRMVGRSTYNAKLAKENGGMVLAADHQHAKLIERNFGVPARSIEVNLHGYSGPFFIDHFAIDKLLLSAARKIETLEEEIQIQKEAAKENEYAFTQTIEALNEKLLFVMKQIDSNHAEGKSVSYSEIMEEFESLQFHKARMERERRNKE
jgi:hypothetical protein